MGVYVSPQVYSTMEYIMSATMKFTTTPATIIISLCHAGFARNSHGLTGAFICSVSMDSSIIPAIFTYPPKGSHPNAYVVSLRLGLNLKIENHGSKNRQKRSTRTLKSFAARKCPPSCRNISIEKHNISCKALIRNVSI